MQYRFTRRAALLGLVIALLAGALQAPAAAQRGGFWDRLIGTFVRGTVTAVDATAGTVQITNRDGLSVTLRTDATTVILRDRRTATLADLRTDDQVLAFYDRTTLLARRIEAATPPPVDLTGTITALDATAGTVQLTTNHGTAITLTTNADTRVRLNGRATTLGNVALGQRARASYRPENKVALTLDAATAEPGVVSGAITAVDLTAGTLQITPLAGAPRSLKLSPETQFRLNGRRVATSAIVVGLLASVQTQPDDTARVVAAQTPPLVDLAGTISALNVQGSTLEVTTQAMTTIQLRLTPTTTVQRDGAQSSPDRLAIGDRVVVRYEYLLLPGQSRALRIIATSAPPTTPPPTTPPPTTTPPTTGVTVTSLTMSPASVVGGTPSTGTVTLSGPAPAGGATVTLTSNNTAAATVPATVVVAEGATSATFTATTSAVTALTPVTLAAAYAGATVEAALTVTPATQTPPP